jgi:DNA modification methylase
MMHLKDPDTYVHQGDCIPIMRAMADETIDLIFADPPFNWGRKYGEWDDSLPQEDYNVFTYKWIGECVRLLKQHGAIWVNVPDDIAADIVNHMKSHGMTMINWCIWHFRFGQCRDTNFIVSKTHALYFAMNPKKRTFNSPAILEPSDRASKYKDKRTLSSSTPGERVPLDVWYGPNWGRVTGNSRERRPGHDNQLPEVYLERVIKACSNPDDLVLDPFLGSGTTSTVARALGRRSIGIEYSEANSASAFDRIKAGPVRVKGKIHGSERAELPGEVPADLRGAGETEDA